MDGQKQKPRPLPWSFEARHWSKSSPDAAFFDSNGDLVTSGLVLVQRSFL